MKNLDPYTGDKFIDEIHDGTSSQFRRDREAEGASDRDIGTAARVLEEAAQKWRDARTNLTWLIETHLRAMATFAVITDCKATTTSVLTGNLLVSRSNPLMPGFSGLTRE